MAGTLQGVSAALRQAFPVALRQAGVPVRRADEATSKRTGRAPSQLPTCNANSKVFVVQHVTTRVFASAILQMQLCEPQACLLDSSPKAQPLL